MSPSGFARIIPARVAETKEVEAFPYLAASFTSPLPLEEDSADGDQPVSAEITTPEENARRLASVDQIIYDKLQQAERQAQDIARKAYEEGFEAGEAEGRAFGESQYRSYIQRLETALTDLSQSAALLGQATEEEVISLALALGEYLAAQQIEQSPQAIRPLLESVLENHPFNAPDSAAALVVFLTSTKGFQTREFLAESRFELRKVVWPTRQEAMRMSWVVMIVVVVISLMLAGFDLVIQWAIRLLLGN